MFSAMPRVIITLSSFHTKASSTMNDAFVPNDEAEFRQMEFRQIADNLPTLCWLADKDGKVIYRNKRWFQYCGVPETVDVNDGLHDYYDPDVLSWLLEKWHHSISTGEDFKETFPLRGADGNYRSFLTHAVPIRVKGEIVRWLGISVDVTEQIRIENELRQSEECLRTLNQNLEKRVQDRADALRSTEEQLRQSQKMEAVGQLTGGIAHDFNNLLAGIMGNLELMQLRIQQQRYDGIDRFVTNAQAAGNRAAALTQRLLAFSRRQTLDPKATPLLKLIGGMEELIKRTIGPGIQLKIECFVEDCIVNIDAPQLENALLNLCINSRDALPDGGNIVVGIKEIYIDSAKSELYSIDIGQYVKICVADNGCGMDATTMSKAFDPFFTTKPIGQGTGLGLSMIYGFSRQSKGHVVIESVVDIGTTVSIYLPRFTSGDRMEKPDIYKEKQISCGKGCILLVDDEEGIRYLVKEVLTEAGYHVETAADGQEALKFVESSMPIDLLITDVGLPNGLNGRQVADATRAMRPGTKVLFITGYAEQSVMDGNDFDEITELLTKPFALHDLVHRSAKLIG